MQKPDDILCGDDVVLDRPPSDLYITYSVYWGTIREIVKMIDFKGKWAARNRPSIVPEIQER
jgi:hypothetical protein